MDIGNVISLVGGLALFLYGMTVMGNGLEKLSGGKMEKTLEKLTSNLFLSVIVGAVVTATIQSSSATTVIVVGLVNAKILGLRQAIGVIMGANIGTTITSQIIRLSDITGDSFFLTLMKPKTLAPLAATIGIVIYLSAKSNKKREFGQIFLGFSVLFTGLFAMEAAVEPLRELPQFVELLSSLSNPVLGVLAGAFVTAVIQSSSASVGILQAISSTGVLSFSSAIPIIMGQNIGTCITPILSSIGASKNAKRSALIHLYFNIVGTITVLVGFYGVMAMVGGFSFWDEAITKTGIANFHTLFNIVVTFLFLPFTGLLEKLAYSTIKDTDEELQQAQSSVLDERFIVSPSLALQQTRHVLIDMGKNAQANYHDCISLVDQYDFKLADRVRELENTIDKADDSIESYLIRLSTEGELGEKESRGVTTLMHLISEYERIGDYSINIMEAAEEIHENQTPFSEQATHEIGVLAAAVGEIIALSLRATSNGEMDLIHRIEPLEDTIDKIVQVLKDRHVQRLKSGSCHIYSGIVFLEILTNLERIGDHCSNIAIYLIGEEDEEAITDKHTFIETKVRNTAEYQMYKQEYNVNYYQKIKEGK